jgi:hypothetical protein
MGSVLEKHDDDIAWRLLLGNATLPVFLNKKPLELLLKGFTLRPVWSWQRDAN